MRAQISGLEQAQSNAKSGINLMQTAEGALTEVHDMLNRMYTLAEQSANGTYDDSVDRVQLQKEVGSLRKEINRIADSTNFNGIKLLAGSLEPGGDMSTKVDFSTKLPGVGTTLGKDTILHKASEGGTGGTSFAIDLHNVAVEDGEVLSITLGEGDKAVTLTYKADGNKAGSALVNDILDGLKTTADGTTKGDTLVGGAAVETDSKVKINGQVFTVGKSTDGHDQLTFTQDTAPTQDSEEVDPSMKVTISNASISKPSAAETEVQEKAAVTINGTVAAGDEIKIGDGLHQEQHSGAVHPGHAGPGQSAALGRAPAPRLRVSRKREQIQNNRLLPMEAGGCYRKWRYFTPPRLR